MVSSAFAPSPPQDLVLPERSSMTARAVTSLALRKLFDWLKSSDLPAANPGLAELRGLVTSFMPGAPKRAAALVDSPSVSAHLRLVRRGEDGLGSLAEAALRAARSELDGRPVPEDRRGAPFLGRSAFVTATPSAFHVAWPLPSVVDLDEFTDRLREAHALLRSALPGIAEALERVVRAVVPTADASGVVRVEAHAPAVLGIPAEGSAYALARALARATVTALLVLLRELAALGEPEVFEVLGGAARAAVDARLVSVLDATGRSVADAAAAHAAFEAAFRALEPHRNALTPVAEGVFQELERHAGYHRRRETKGEGDE